MKVIIFGSTGMIGQGVLGECIKDAGVEKVLAIVRTSSGALADPKVRELCHKNLFDYSSIEKDISGYDACLFCLGVSSGGMNEADYSHLTYDLTIAAAQALVRLNPQMTFEYISGASTDSTEKGSTMWARVKGRTENALLAMPFRAAYMFRPGIIQPLSGIKSKTPSYRLLYAIMSPALPLLRRLFPNKVTTTERFGRAMIRVARDGYPKKILETSDIEKMSS